jgi:hypothetical protein
VRPRAWFFVPTSANGAQMWGTVESKVALKMWATSRLTLFSTRL